MLGTSGPRFIFHFPLSIVRGEAVRGSSFHTVPQTVLDFWPRPLSLRAPSYSGTAATTAGLCLSGNKTRLAVVHPSGPLSVLSVLLSSFLFSFLCYVLGTSGPSFSPFRGPHEVRCVRIRTMYSFKNVLLRMGNAKARIRGRMFFEE